MILKLYRKLLLRRNGKQKAGEFSSICEAVEGLSVFLKKRLEMVDIADQEITYSVVNSFLVPIIDWIEEGLCKIDSNISLDKLSQFHLLLTFLDQQFSNVVHSFTSYFEDLVGSTTNYKFKSLKSILRYNNLCRLHKHDSGKPSFHLVEIIA